MPELPKKKVGIVACSGEELPEGTVTRLAALKVLEELRPADTVTICLPLFLAGGEGDRAFARFYPTIALDGCEERCAARATEMYSGTPAASFVVSDLLADNGWEPIYGCRKLNDAGMQAVADTAELSYWARPGVGALAHLSNQKQPLNRKMLLKPPVPVGQVSRFRRFSSRDKT